MSPRSCVVSSTVTPSLAVDLDEEVAHALLRDDVEADRRLVEEQELGLVQHRRRQLAADALAERELAHRRVRGTGRGRARSRKRARLAR